MAKIFISYKRKNKEQVFSIVRYVESRLGIKCWVDLDGIESSVQFASVICRAIDTAEVVLFMHSSAHTNIDFENDWTIKELNYAHAKKKRVVLVKLDSTPLDNIFLMEYGSKNNIDSRERMQLERLIADLSHWLGVNARQPEPAKPSSAVNIEKNAVATVAPKPVKGVNASVADCKVYSAEVTVEEAEICRKYIDMVVHHRLDRSKLEEKIEAMAKCGKTEAEYALGFGEYRPYGSNIKVGGDKHYLAAEHWLKKAAGKGHIKAQSLLAEMYFGVRNTTSRYHGPPKLLNGAMPQQLAFSHGATGLLIIRRNMSKRLKGQLNFRSQPAAATYIARRWSMEKCCLKVDMRHRI